MPGLIKSLSLIVSLVASQCTAFPNRNGSIPLAFKTGLGSGLPIIVTAQASSSTANGQIAGIAPADLETTTVTVTNVVFTTVAETTLISKPISSQVSTESSSRGSSQISTTSDSSISAQSDSHSSVPSSSHASDSASVPTSSQAVSTTNALQVLSAAEQSFLAQSHESSISQMSMQVASASSNAGSSSLLPTASVPFSLPKVVTSSPPKPKQTGDKTEDGNHHTSAGGRDSGTNSDSHETTSTRSSGEVISINSHGIPIVNGSPSHSTAQAKTSSNLVDPVSVSAMSSSSTCSSSSSLPPMLNPATATSSMDVTAVFGNGIPQGTFTATNSAGSRFWKGTRLKVLAAPVILIQSFTKEAHTLLYAKISRYPQSACSS